jgi:hypothetical protein
MALEMAPSAEVSISAFLLLHGHCFRMIKSDTCLTIHCDEPVVWKGPWRDVKGEVWIVEACAKHRPNEAP